jgi:hypothetical protein
VGFCGGNGEMCKTLTEEHSCVPNCAAVVGGSISVGLGEDGFGPGVFRRVAAAFPNATHRFHNGALGGVTSTYMNSCLKWHVPPDVDLVIVSVLPRHAVLYMHPGQQHTVLRSHRQVHL